MVSLLNFWEFERSRHETTYLLVFRLRILSFLFFFIVDKKRGSKK